MPFGDSNDVNVLVGFKDSVNGDLLFKMLVSPVDFVRDGSTVELDFHQLSFLLTYARLADLRVSQDTNHGGVLLQTVQGGSDLLTAVLLVLAGVLGKGLALASIPILVETATEIIAQVLSKHGRDGAQSTGGLDVAGDTDDDHWGRLDDGNGFDNFFLVHFGTGTVQITDNVGHPSLVAHEGSQVDGFLGIVLGERLDLTLGASSAFAW